MVARLANERASKQETASGGVTVGERVTTASGVTVGRGGSKGAAVV